jgi:hypothetical protein
MSCEALHLFKSGRLAASGVVSRGTSFVSWGEKNNTNTDLVASFGLSCGKSYGDDNIKTISYPKAEMLL